MKKLLNKKNIIIAVSIICIAFIALFVVKVSNKTVSVSSKNDEYTVVKQTIIGNDTIYRIASNAELTEDEMKEIYEKYSKNSIYNTKIWFFDNEDNAQNLESYNIAEITKENGKYVINKYGEETDLTLVH